MTMIGRPCLFPNKMGGKQVHGFITRFGKRAFDRQRVQLGRLYLAVTGRRAPRISDADVIEFLARGDANTRAFFQGERNRGEADAIAK